MDVQISQFRKKIAVSVLAIICGQLMAGSCLGQRAQFPDFFQVQTGPPLRQLPATIQGSGVTPGPLFQNTSPPTYYQQPITSPILTGPSFDPFNVNTTPLPQLPSQTPGGNVLFGNQGPDSSYSFQNQAPPPSISFGDSYQMPPVLQPNVGDGYQFGNSSGGFSNNPNAWPSQSWSTLRNSWLPRLIEHPRFRHTWISGENGNELGLDETELASTLTLPNFLRSNQPLLISPGFAFHFWDGPDTALTGFDIPAITYSPYLSTESTTDTRRNAGLEGNLALGVYSDFRNVNSESLRVTGTGLGWLKIDQATTFKVGIEYLDRINVKMLPAIGFFIQPNADMKLDLYFPRPRFAKHLPKIGNYDVWGYVGGEYGGGSWTIKRMGGANDQVDVNDVRAFIGLEWLGPRRVTGFVESGYVFEREMLYRSNPLNKLDIQDAIMVRGGFSF